MTRIVVSFAALISLSSCAKDDGRNPADIPAEELVQPGCENDEDCPGGVCIAGIGDGLCTAACTSQEHCPDGTICVDTESEFEGVCLLACEDSAYCTQLLGTEYNCDTESNLVTGEDVWVCIDSK